MNRRLLATVSAAALALGVHVAPAYAQHGHGASGHTAPPTSHGSTTHGPTSSHGAATHGSSTHGPTTHGSSSHGSSTHATTHGSAHSTTAKSSHGTTKTSKTTTTTTTKTATTTTGTTLTPVQQKLTRNTNLAAKLQSRLPAGTDLMAAAAGFRNLGQFVAAVNVSNNLGIPFTQLKTDMVTKGMSLGQSIQDLRPSADSTTIATKAEHDATTLINQTTTTTTTTSTKSKKHSSSGQ